MKSASLVKAILESSTNTKLAKKKKIATRVKETTTPSNHVSNKNTRQVDGERGLGSIPSSKTIPQITSPKQTTKGAESPPSVKVINRKAKKSSGVKNNIPQIETPQDNSAFQQARKITVKKFIESRKELESFLGVRLNLELGVINESNFKDTDWGEVSEMDYIEAVEKIFFEKYNVEDPYKKFHFDEGSAVITRGQQRGETPIQFVNNTIRDYKDSKKRKQKKTTQLGEDWGSSDWSALINSMNDDLKGQKINPETITHAAQDAAEMYYDHMGYETAEDAVDRIISMWMTRNGWSNFMDESKKKS
jgi:hypothetical protein